MDAAEDALRLIGGDQLVSMVTATYEAIHKAELRGQMEGFTEGHRIGVIDGRAQPEVTVIEDTQPSDEGLAGLADAPF